MLKQSKPIPNPSERNDPSALRESHDPEPPLLSAQGVSVRLGRHSALRDVSFNARPGAITSVLGPNGAGKTTLLRALAGLLGYQGRISLGETSLSKLSPVERARRIAYVPQTTLLSAPLPVREVVEQGRYCHNPGLRSLRAADHAAVDSAL